jgi:hypothetical protein
MTKSHIGNKLDIILDSKLRYISQNNYYKRENERIVFRIKLNLKTKFAGHYTCTMKEQKKNEIFMFKFNSQPPTTHKLQPTTHNQHPTTHNQKTTTTHKPIRFN